MIIQEIILEILRTILSRSIPDKVFFLLRIWYSLNVFLKNSFSVSSDSILLSVKSLKYSYSWQYHDVLVSHTSQIK